MRASLAQRGRIALVLLAVTSTLAAAPGAGHARQTTQVHPNILLVVTDDQRAGTLDTMPNTRRFFQREGVSYAQAFATSPLCCPSRASIMTGRYPHNHGVRRNEEADNLVQESTIQYYLQGAGYQTGLVGKYLNGWVEAEAAPPYFDRWAAIDDASYSRVYYDFTANVDGTVVNPTGYSTDFISERSRDFLKGFEGEDTRPWFLYVAPFAPHKPFKSEPSYRSAPTARWRGNPAVFESNREDKPLWVQNRHVRLPGGRAISQKQQRTLMSVDDMVGRLSSTLDQLDETRDTLAIFVSDNGYLWGEHGLASKRFPYTGAIQVPLIVRWPGHVGEGSVDDRIAANIDLAPTILDAAGTVPDPEFPIDGRSLFSPAGRDRILLEYFGAGLGTSPPWASIRSGAYQYIEYYDDLGTVRFKEYYDLANDPFQLQNLFADGTTFNDPPWVVLATQLARARSCSGAECP